MTRFVLPRIALLLATPLLALGCGDDAGDVSSSTVPASTSPAAPPSGGTALTVTVGTEAKPSLASATLTIAADGTALGTGYLSDPTAAAAAAALLDAPTNVTRLVEGEPVGQICTEIFGGPDLAVVTGTVAGAAVATQFHRSNGCGIADWETFTPLVGRPRWAGEQRIYFREETATSVPSGTGFLIELASNATTGYQWVATSSDPTRVKVGAPTYVPPPEAGAVGVGGWEQFAVEALAAGTATVTFEYRRSFEPAETPPADTVVFTVTVTG